ncbi:hypothetical protein [Mesorhizobium sp. M2A.F.Ca.ET.043.02.1.1]|uniref:hypothetical protein n=1 Tax=Mesorhizobium sp. M2A.F.Ca.ET.043.02.1.1 TaxID=2493670 RepID=UPI0032B26CEF
MLQVARRHARLVFGAIARPAASREFCSWAASSLVPIRSMDAAKPSISGTMATAVATAKLPRFETQNRPSMAPALVVFHRVLCVWSLRAISKKVKMQKVLKYKVLPMVTS